MPNSAPIDAAATLRVSTRRSCFKPQSDYTVLKLYHCRGARSLRPLWALEELDMAYELIPLPFPPRALAKDFLELNPLGTIPYLVDGDVRMSESVAICLYLASRYGPTELAVSESEPDYPAFLNWLFFSDATLTFPQTIVLRYRHLEPAERRLEQAALDYEKWFFGRLRFVEQALSDRQWLCARRFTVADIAIVYALYLAEDILQWGAGFGPNVRSYIDRARARPGFQRALAVDAQAPAWR